MGKQAARMGDMVKTCGDPADAPTSTVVAAGTVMINKLPAAKMNDQVVGVDVHIIMIPTPGGPVPTPLPHPYMGMIQMECSQTVKIMGQPAAVVGSKSMGQPPHIPQGGPFQKPPSNQGEIIMGSFDVMIGDGSGGGGGGGGGGDGTQSTAAQATEREGHTLDVKFVDKGGNPISGGVYVLKSPSGTESGDSLTGQIKQGGVEEGNHEIAIKAISEAKWSTATAKVGDKVKLQVKTVGIKDGTEAELQIMIRDSHFPDEPLELLKSTVSGDKIEEEWELQVEKKLAPRQQEKRQTRKYSSPSFFFRVTVDGMQQKSGVLQFKDWVELEYTDEEGNALANKPYKIRASNGVVKTGTLDSNGKAKLENIPPGQVETEVDPR